MDKRQLPSVELIQGPTPIAHPEQGRGGWRRWKVFLSILLIAGVAGVVIVYSQSPVYRASAQILTVKPKAIDAKASVADAEHVAIQGRLLLGDDLLGRVGRRLAEADDPVSVDADRLRMLLDVASVPDTNLLELRAEGDDPTLLQRVVNSWADAYQVFRAEQIDAATGTTTREIEDERIRLEAKVEQSREALRAFREQNQIVGLERDENQSLASLKGLNNSLNKSREQLIEARARKAAIDDAIARGETVVPDQQKEQIAFLRLEVQRIQGLLTNLRGKYTQNYLDRDPVLKALPQELGARQQELNSALAIANQTVRDEANQQVATAQRSLEAIQAQLESQQVDVQQFNERYETFTRLKENLSRLETLLADNRERLAQIQVKNEKDFPPMQIVDRAGLPSRPIHPDYNRDLMIALGAALLLALFGTWLTEYLSEKPKTQQAPPYVGVRIVTGEPQAALSGHSDRDYRLDHMQHAASLTAPAQPASPPVPVLPRELGGGEVQVLMDASDTRVNLCAALLLSGVSPYELQMIHRDLLDPARNRLEVPGASARSISLASGAWRRLDGLVHAPNDTHGAMPVAELDHHLRGAAQAAGLAEPNTVNAMSLWHTFVVYLLRQGIDDDALVARVGMIPPDILRALRDFSPPDGTRAVEHIDFVYPALAY